LGAALVPLVRALKLLVTGWSMGLVGLALGLLIGWQDGWCPMKRYQVLELVRRGSTYSTGLQVLIHPQVC
jgi:hypothetical protein